MKKEEEEVTFHKICFAKNLHQIELNDFPKSITLVFRLTISDTKSHTLY